MWHLWNNQPQTYKSNIDWLYVQLSSSLSIWCPLYILRHHWLYSGCVSQKKMNFRKMCKLRFYRTLNHLQCSIPAIYRVIFIKCPMFRHQWLSCFLELETWNFAHINFKTIQFDTSDVTNLKYNISSINW